MIFQSHHLAFEACDFCEFGSSSSAKHAAVASVQHAIDSLGPTDVAALHAGLMCGEDTALDLGLKLASIASMKATRGWSIWTSQATARPAFTLTAR